MSTSFDDRWARLVANLELLAGLLGEHGESWWQAWAVRCAGQLSAFDPVAFDRVLGAFGGMGSLEDLMLLPVNGHRVAPGEESAVNDRLSSLRTAVRADATSLRHELGTSST